jgi:IS5 family transposase
VKLTPQTPREVVKTHLEDFMIYWRALLPKRTDKNKIYSLEAPQVECLAKGKEHKKSGLAGKDSVVITAES